jgi:nicotinamidase-related amidase
MERKLKQGPERNDLNGNAPDDCDVALLLIDVINDLEFEGGDQLARHARPMARHLAELKQRAQAARVPCIYANDNYGRWRSDFSAQVEHCLHRDCRGAFLAEALQPTPTDYFVLKPMHSGFYQTCLELLLNHLGTRTLVVGGIATDNCVNFTSNDAYIRGYQLVILSDGCASIDAKAHRVSLSQMERLLHARTARCQDISFARRGGRVDIRIRPA